MQIARSRVISRVVSDRLGAWLAWKLPSLRADLHEHWGSMVFIALGNVYPVFHPESRVGFLCDTAARMSVLREREDCPQVLRVKVVGDNYLVFSYSFELRSRRRR